jgi:hypothetical protein
MKIDLEKLNCDSLFSLFATLDSIEQYYTHTAPDDSIVVEMQQHKQEINRVLALDDMMIVKEGDDCVLDCI